MKSPSFAMRMTGIIFCVKMALMIRFILKSEIEEAVKKLFKKEVGFDVSADGKFGDYSSNVAMVLGVGAPREVAEEIKGELEKSKKFGKIVSKIEIADPGFLNFTLSEKGLIEGLKSLGCSAFKRKKKIQVEFISANPTGELHIGHARSAFFGDALANVLEAAGHKAEREYFINDSKESTQIKELGKTVLGKGKSYLTNYLKSQILSAAADKSVIKNENEGEAGYLIAKEIQKDNREFITKGLGIKIDKWFSEEKELREKGAFEKTLDLLKKKKMVYEKHGALWLKTSEFGDDEDRVLVRSDGSVSYFLSDIAYHINKFKRGYDAVIDIWGADHQGHVKRMMAVKKMLASSFGIGKKCDLEILISQMVTLMEGGERKKLSKRKGTIVLLKDLVDEIGIDAARWFYLQKSLSTHMEFDLALAKERSRKNPVFYVQYAHARTHSILAKSHTSKKATSSPRASIYKSNNDPTAPPALTSQGDVGRGSPRVEEVAFFSAIRDFQAELLRNTPSRNLVLIVLKIIQFPEIIEDTAEDYQVQRIASYAYDLANEFSQFYRDVKVIGSENEKELVALVSLTGKTIKDALKLLGISAPEKM